LGDTISPSAPEKAAAAIILEKKFLRFMLVSLRISIDIPVLHYSSRIFTLPRILRHIRPFIRALLKDG
jgi:hypothetical protein